MSHLTLRPASTVDAPAIASVLHSAFDEYRTLLDPPSGVHNETVETILDKMQSGTWYLALSDGELAGVVLAEPRGDYMYLGRLGVLPAWRRRGVADRLIAAVEEQARRSGLRSVRLGVRLALTSVRAAYERRGYVPFEYQTHSGFTTPTWVMLEKCLSTSDLHHATE